MLTPHVRRSAGIGGSGVHIDIDFGRSPLMVAFLAVWLAGWLLLLAATGLEVWRSGPQGAPLKTVLFPVFLLAGAPICAALLWAATGCRESIVIENGELRVQRGIGSFRRGHRFPPFTLQDVQIVPGGLRPLRRLAAARQFWIRGAGRLVLVANGKTFAAGVLLDDGEAFEIRQAIENGVPAAQESVEVPRQGTSDASLQWLAGLISIVMLLPVAKLPFGVLIQDRVTCLGVTREEPLRPVDVRLLSPPGGVGLVPIDGFPVSTAESIAGHFRERFGTPISVQPPVAAPAFVFDNWRAQLNAHAMAALLDERSPASAERRVLIGLTRSDMYIPGLGWSYAFSYRSTDRLVAVVSSARMDHGCMSLVLADEARQLDRLRKMVGKNIGVLHYRLPLSRDPRSMLYAQVGGPQELDVMADSY